MPNSLQEIINGLESARKKKPALADVIDLHQELLEAQKQVKPVSAPALPTSEEVEQSLQQGIPLFHLSFPTFDWQTVDRLADDVCRIVAKHRPDLTDDIHPINQYLHSQNGQLEPLVTRYLNNEITNITTNNEQPIDPNLLTFILTQTLRPFLQAKAQDLQSKTCTEQSRSIKNSQSKIDLWGRPICPMCGGLPDFAAFVSNKEANNDGHGRRLLCGHCNTEWGYKRSGCPFCEETGQWSYFSDENKALRLYVCDACHRYLKTVDWRETFAHRSLPVARVITIDMDVAAAQAGCT